MFIKIQVGLILISAAVEDLYCSAWPNILCASLLSRPHHAVASLTEKQRERERDRERLKKHLANIKTADTFEKFSR